MTTHQEERTNFEPPEKRSPRPFLHCLSDGPRITHPREDFPGIYKTRAAFLASQGQTRCFSCGSANGAETMLYKLTCFSDILKIAREGMFRSPTDDERKEAIDLLNRMIDAVMFHDKSRD
jgi:hypothetical protein